MAAKFSMVLSDEQLMLQESARAFFNSNLDVDAFRKSRDAEGVVQFDAGLWQQMAGLGWPAVLVPEQLGGLGFGIKGIAVIAIEAARHLAVSPLQSAATLGVEALLKCQQSSSRDELIQQIAAGEQAPTIALESGSEKCEFVAEGMASSSLLLVDAETKVLSLYDLSDAEISRNMVSLIDRRDYAHIQLGTVDPMQAFDIEDGDALGHLNDTGALITSCELFGIASEAFDRTIAYLCEREQFGQKIGAFQGLQHRMAQAYMQLQMFKSVLYDALDAAQNNRDDRQIAISHAKVMANDVSQLICTEAIQMHGGMGITDELDIGLFYKRARVLRTNFGSTAFHKNRFAKFTGL